MYSRYLKIRSALEDDLWDRVDVIKNLDEEPDLIAKYGSDLLYYGCFHLYELTLIEIGTSDREKWLKNFTSTRDFLTHLLRAGAQPNDLVKSTFIDCLCELIRNKQELLSPHSFALWKQTPTRLEDCLALTGEFINKGLSLNTHQADWKYDAVVREMSSINICT